MPEPACAIIDIIAVMAAITIRNLDPVTKEKLRVRAAVNGRSMEAEARALIEDAVVGPYAAMNVGQAFRAMAESVGYLDDLELPSRKEPYERSAPFSEKSDRENDRHAAKSQNPAKRKPRAA